MIFVSSSCIRKSTIGESVEALAKEGFLNIELSGGTKPYPELESDLIRLKEQYGLQYLVHNYFPPPSKSFVLNLASLDDEIFTQSFEHCKRAIELSKRIGSKAYGVHAGFFINISVDEIGKALSKDRLYDTEECTQRFIKAYSELNEFARTNGIELYMENNVLSKTNHTTFDGINPLMCTDLASINALNSQLNFELILDVAHLKVSCNTMNLDFEAQLSDLFEKSNYIHISDNDGLSDSNQGLKKDSSLLKQLTALDFSEKVVTLEIYDSLDVIRESLENLETTTNVG